MTPEQWKKVKEALADVMERPSHERAEYLDHLCIDPALRREVEALLAAHDEGNSVLDKLIENIVLSAFAQFPTQKDKVPGRFGRYEIVSLLGRGGMGAVYLGLDTQLGRQVAIKILPDETARDPAVRDRFLREARAAAALNHPSICAIYSIEEEKDLLFLVLEYVRGQTFQDLIIEAPPGWPPEPAVAAGYILQVAEALQVAHEAGIIHRDIKSSNLMRTVGDRVKVLDFGLAKVTGASRLTGDDFRLGTPAYASPEQIRGEPIDDRSDLWSVGVVFYEILTGHLPFSGDNVAALVRALLNDKPRPLRLLRPVVPTAIEHVVEVLLSKSPDRRYASAQNLIDVLRPLVLATRPDARTASGAQSGIHALLGTAERRSITFLHVELMVITASQDPEDFQAALENSREICAKVVERHQGNMQPWVGNTSVALFGYPEALENGARLAVAAGLALAGAFGRGQLGFNIRIGIATALTVVSVGGVGTISSEGFEFASSLARRAGTNEVLIADTTERLVEGYFALGQEEEVSVGQRRLRFRPVRQASLARSRFQVIPSSALTPLAGRDHELQLLLRQWQRALERQTQITLVGGEPGLGKSRLVYELKQHVARNPAAAMAECFCAQQYANSALYPVIDCLERIWFETDVRAMTPDEKLRVIEGSLAELGFVLSETVPLFAQLLNVAAPSYPALEITPGRQRSLTLQALVSMVIERASRQPFLLLVEDVQWADPTTLELLRMLVEQEPTVSLMALYTHRPDYVPQWSISGHVSSISLNRLTHAESLAVVAAAAHAAALDVGTTEQIADNSDGVPLFLEEMTKAVVEYGAGDSHETKLLVPGNLRDSFIARLDRLGAARNIVRMASVLGRQFPQTLLAAVSGLAEERLQENLDPLVDAEVFYVRGAGHRRTYIFKHALLQNAAYDSLLKKARVELHRQVAELLVNRFPELASRQPEVVAGHFTEAGLGEQSIIYWHQAGMSALRRSAYLEAVSHFQQGLRVLRALPANQLNPEQEILLLAGLGPALIATQGFGADEVGETFRKAEELLPKSGNSSLFLPTLWGVWVYHLVRSRLDHALATAVQMVDSGRLLKDDDTLLEGLWTAGNTLYWQGDLIAARRYLEDAERLYEPVRFRDHAYRFGQDCLVATLCYQSFVYCFLGLFERATIAGDRAVEVARSLRHPFSIGWSLTFRATLDCFMGNFAAARKWGDSAVQYCQQQAYPFWISAALSASGKSMAEMDEVEGGIGRLREGIAMTRAIGSRVIEPLYRGQLSEALLRAGNGAAALAESEEAIRQASEQGVGISRLDLLRIRGLALSALGDRVEAEAALRECILESRAASCRYTELRAAADLAQLTQDAAPLADVCATLSRGPGEPPVLSWARKVLEAR